MSFVVTAVIAVGSQIYAADRQRKALHQQADAAKAAREEDARKAAEAETGAAVAANAELAAKQRRRRSSSLLSSGDPAYGDTLGGSPTVLAAGAGPVSRGASGASGVGYSATALGAGAPAIGSAYAPSAAGGGRSIGKRALA